MLGLEYYEASAEAFRAALDSRPGWEDAAWNHELAHLRAERTRQAMRQQANPDNPESEQESENPDADPTEGEEGDPSDEEGEFEESEESGEGEPSNQSSSQMAMDLENQDIPPPILDPEDIFREEAANNESREKNSGRRYTPTERDW